MILFLSQVGLCVKNLPEIDETLPTADILVYAETLKEMIYSFLKPEEITDLLRVSNLINNIEFFLK